MANPVSSLSLEWWDLLPLSLFSQAMVHGLSHPREARDGEEEHTDRAAQHERVRHGTESGLSGRLLWVWKDEQRLAAHRTGEAGGPGRGNSGSKSTAAAESKVSMGPGTDRGKVGWSLATTVSHKVVQVMDKKEGCVPPALPRVGLFISWSPPHEESHGNIRIFWWQGRTLLPPPHL